MNTKKSRAKKRTGADPLSVKIAAIRKRRGRSHMPDDYNDDDDIGRPGMGSQQSEDLVGRNGDRGPDCADLLRRMAADTGAETAGLPRYPEGLFDAYGPRAARPWEWMRER